MYTAWSVRLAYLGFRTNFRITGQREVVQFIKVDKFKAVHMQSFRFK